MVSKVRLRTAKETEELTRHWVKLYRCAVCEMPRKEAESLLRIICCSKKCERDWKEYLRWKQVEIKEREEKRREAIRDQG
jgi:hypothetical protein